MNDQQYLHDDHAHWGLPTALPDELPPSDQSLEVQGTEVFSFAGLVSSLGIAAVGIFLVFFFTG